MDCKEAKKFLYVFLDNELSVQENVEILHHLEHCKYCFNTFEQERIFQRVVKLQAESETAPEALRQSILSGLKTFSQSDQTERGRFPLVFSRLRILALAACLIVGLGITYIYITNGPGSPVIRNIVLASDLATSLNEAHLDSLDQKISLYTIKDGAELQTLLSSKIQQEDHIIRVCIPMLKDSPLQLEGGLICRTDLEFSSSMSCFNIDGNQVSFFCFQVKELDLEGVSEIELAGKSVCLIEEKGNTVVFWSAGACYHSVVTSLQKKETLDVVEQFVSSHY